MGLWRSRQRRRDIARRVFALLEDHRVLHTPIGREDPDACLASTNTLPGADSHRTGLRDTT